MFSLAIIEVLVFLVAILFCFYLFMELVYPFFTNGKVKPGWLFFSKYLEKQKAKEQPKNNTEENSENKTT